jgi:hypothetical protein
MENFSNAKTFVTTKLTNFLTLGINAKEDYTKLFDLSLGISKVSLLIIFIVVTLVYQIKYNNVKWAKTLLNNNQFFWKTLSNGGIVAAFSVFSLLLFYRLRLESTELKSENILLKIIKQNWETLLFVFIIVFIFDITKESSGLNRFLDSKELNDNENDYNKISENEIKIFNPKNLETQGDPFTNSIAWTSIYFIGIIILYLILMMFIALGYGIKSGENGVPNVKLFIFELIGLFVLNYLGSIITFIIRKRRISGGLVSSSIIAVIAVIIHIFSQFTGVFNKKK